MSYSSPDFVDDIIGAFVNTGLVTRRQLDKAEENEECDGPLAGQSLLIEETIVKVSANRAALANALKRWQKFAKDNGWTDADCHDADGTGWITLTDTALKDAR